MENTRKDIDTFAVDGDILAYRTAAVCEEDFEGACYALLDKQIADIAERTGIKKYLYLFLYFP